MSAASKKRILVVDDDPVSCQLISEILAEESYDIEPAMSSADALEKMSRDEYSLVVSDVFMPGMSGTVLASRIHRVRPDVPILFVTAFPNLTTETDARALGVPILAKPFAPDALVQRVRYLLGEGSMA